MLPLLIARPERQIIRRLEQSGLELYYLPQVGHLDVLRHVHCQNILCGLGPKLHWRRADGGQAVAVVHQDVFVVGQIKRVALDDQPVVRIAGKHRVADDIVGQQGVAANDRVLLTLAPDALAAPRLQFDQRTQLRLVDDGRRPAISAGLEADAQCRSRSGRQCEVDAADADLLAKISLELVEQIQFDAI